MYSPAPVKWLVAMAVVLGAMSLSAQRYDGRDHHTYHPPVQSKHQTPQATNTRAHTTTSANASTGHNANSTGVQSPSNHSASSSSKADAMAPLAPQDRQPQ